MEVQFTPELKKKLNDLAAATTDDVRSTLGRLPGSGARRSCADAGVHGEVGNDAEIAHRGVV